MFNIFKRYYYRIVVQLYDNTRGYYVVKAKNKAHAEQRFRKKFDCYSTIVEIELI